MNSLCEWITFARLAKCSPEEFKAYVRNDNFEFYRSKKPDTEVYSYYGENKLIFTFRGTEPDARDWLTDVDGFSVPYDNPTTPIRVHRGFYRAYKSVREWVLGQCKKHDKKPHIVCTGHSLGGALCVLAAVDIQYNIDSTNPYLTSIHCYSFGAPAVFNKDGVESYNIRVPNTIRCTNRYDLVPLMPPRLMGYKHVGKHEKIGSWFPLDNPFNHDIEKSYIKYLCKE